MDRARLCGRDEVPGRFAAIGSAEPDAWRTQLDRLRAELQRRPAVFQSSGFQHQRRWRAARLDFPLRLGRRLPRSVVGEVESACGRNARAFPGTLRIACVRGHRTDSRANCREICGTRMACEEYVTD